MRICRLLFTAASPADITASLSWSASVVFVVGVVDVVVGTGAGVDTGVGVNVGRTGSVSVVGMSFAKSKFDNDLVLE